MRDYAKKSFRQRPAQAASKTSAKPFDKKRFWMVWGISLGVILIALVAAQVFYRQYQVHHPVAQKAPAKPVTAKPAPKAVVQKPQFDFYDVLPKTTITAASAPAPSDTASAPEQTAQKQYQFMLQVASYKNKQQAKAMQARLLLMGFKPKIDSTSSGWYRVDVGPFPSRRGASTVMHKIQKANINGSMIRPIPLS